MGRGKAPGICKLMDPGVEGVMLRRFELASETASWSPAMEPRLRLRCPRFEMPAAECCSMYDDEEADAPALDDMVISLYGTTPVYAPSPAELPPRRRTASRSRASWS